MRILHTSDWHLGAQLGPVNRQPQLLRRLEQIAGYLEEHQVEVMVVSGDLFDRRRSRMDEARALWEELQRTFEPFLLRGGTIVAISGNHDHEAFFDTLYSFSRLTAPVTGGGVRPGGRLYLAPKASTLRLRDRLGQEVQFALLPYPTPERYPSQGEEVESGEDRNSRLKRHLTAKLEQIRARLDPAMPSVLVSHVHVSGGRLHNLYDLSLQEDVVFESDLIGSFAYAAYGHIHLPQDLGSPLRKYAGSIERMNKGEMNDAKRVVLVDVVAGEGPAPVSLPLAATPMGEVTLRGEEGELAALQARYSDRETILYYTLDLKPDQNREALRRALQQAFPNNIQQATPPRPREDPREAQAAALSAQLDDWRGTVLRFLEQRLADFPERQRALDEVRGLLDRVEVQP